MRLKELTEAVPIPPTGTTGTAQPNAGGLGTPAPVEEIPMDNKGNPDKGQTQIGQRGYAADDTGEFAFNVKAMHGDTVEVEMDDGSIKTVSRDALMNPDNLINKDLLNRSGDTALKRAALTTQTAMNKGASYANAQKVTVNSSEEPSMDDEINRIQELAGVVKDVPGGTETVIGNTAHKPTDRLRAKLRKDKLKKK